MPKLVKSNGFTPNHFCQNIKQMVNHVKNGTGFTLVELLVAFSIVGLLSLSSFVYYKSLTRDKVLLSAIDSVQTLLRVAQSNATSGFTCGATNKPGKWIVVFSDSTNVNLKCENSLTPVDTSVNPPVSTPAVIKTLTLENNIEIDSIAGSASCSPDLPSSVSFSALNGKVIFTNDDIGDTEVGNACIKNSSTLTITLRDTQNTASCSGSDYCKSFTVSSGGAINVQ